MRRSLAVMLSGGCSFQTVVRIVWLREEGVMVAWRCTCLSYAIRRAVQCSSRRTLPLTLSSLASSFFLEQRLFCIELTNLPG